VFRPGTTARAAPSAPGADVSHHKVMNPDQIKHELDLYLKEYERA
jgi:hypothetical protein